MSEEIGLLSACCRPAVGLLSASYGRRPAAASHGRRQRQTAAASHGRRPRQTAYHGRRPRPTTASRAAVCSKFHNLNPIRNITNRVKIVTPLTIVMFGVMLRTALRYDDRYDCCSPLDCNTVRNVTASVMLHSALHYNED